MARGTGSIYLRGKTWWIKYYVQGNSKPIRESVESADRKDAVALLSKRVNDAATGESAHSPVGKVRMDVLFDLVIQDYIEKEHRDLYITRRRISKHLKTPFGSLRAADIGSDHIKRYIKNRKAAGAANATVNRELAIIRRGFKLAERCDPPKIRKGPHIQDLPEDNARQGFLDQDQYRRLYAEMGRARLALVIGFHIGNRKGEILQMKWSMVDVAGKSITIPGTITKNKKPRKLPLYGELEAELAAALEERNEKWPECQWVVSADGERIRCFKGEWANATKAAGLEGLLFHDLRRSAIRNMKRSGIDEEVAMRISGHLTRETFRRYDIVSEDDIQDAGEKLASYLKSPKKQLGQVVVMKRVKESG